MEPRCHRLTPIPSTSPAFRREIQDMHPHQPPVIPPQKKAYLLIVLDPELAIEACPCFPMCITYRRGSHSSHPVVGGCGPRLVQSLTGLPSVTRPTSDHDDNPIDRSPAQGFPAAGPGEGALQGPGADPFRHRQHAGVPPSGPAIWIVQVDGNLNFGSFETFKRCALSPNEARNLLRSWTVSRTARSSSSFFSRERDRPHGCADQEPQTG